MKAYRYKIVSRDYLGRYLIQLGISRFTVKLKLNTIVNSSFMLESFPPAQAAYLGIQSAKLKLSHLLSLQEVKPEAKKGRYELLSVERSLRVMLLDTKLREQFHIDFYEVLTNQEIIEGMESIQAFYLGFLAGRRNFS